MAAQYPAAIKSFAAIIDGVDYPQATQINQAYDEITAIETALLSTGLTLTSGKIAFPATQNASADANTLDDYEEGPWTPTAVGFTVVGTPTYAGRYTKIGNIVHWTIRVTSTTSTACTSGTSTLTVPPGMTPAFPACCAACDVNTTAGKGEGEAFTDGKIYPPTWAANADIAISGFYMV